MLKSCWPIHFEIISPTFQVSVSCSVLLSLSSGCYCHNNNLVFSTSGPFLDRPQVSRGHWGDFHLICGLFILHQVRMDQTQNGENLCHSTYSLHRLSRLLSFSASSCGHCRAKSFMILHLAFLISHTICLQYRFFVWSGVQALWSSWVSTRRFEQ